MSTKDQISLSVVVPVYSGADFIEQLVERLAALRNDWQEKEAPIALSEVILVNDDAIDDSPSILRMLRERFYWLLLVNLSRNFGQHPATIAGILHSSGDWVVTIDEDLQHPPEYIVNLLERAVTKDADVVYGHAEGDVHSSLFRDLSSKWYKRLISWLTGTPDVRKFSSFRLVRGAISRAAASVCTHETYLDLALTWFTARIDLVPLPLRDQRFANEGKSGYSVYKLLSHARRMLVSTQMRALRIGAGLGAIGFFVAIVYGLYVLYIEIANPDYIIVQGWPSLIVSILFFGGLCALLIGVMLEYITVLLLRAQGMPTFFVVDRQSDVVLREFLKNQWSS